MGTHTTMTVGVKFLVNAEAGDGQTVYVVGDDERIGSWNPQQAVPMEKDHKEKKRWSCSVELDNSSTYSYRFFVGKPRNCKVKYSNSVDLVVIQWETNLRPRQFSSGCQSTLELPEANFGDYDSAMNVSNGWLMDQCEIQLRLHSNPISLWKSQHTDQAYSVKCLAVDCSLKQELLIEEDDDLQSAHSADVLVSNLHEEDCKPRCQDKTGVPYSQDDYIIFRTRTTNNIPLGFHFQFDIYQHSPNRIPFLVGSAHMLPLHKTRSKFNQTLPIIGTNGRSVGAINVETMVIRSVPDVALAMDSSFMNYWNRGQNGHKAMDIGHRGLGESYSLNNDNYKKENTLESFREAGEHGAECVEFDIVMTRDFHPVIYHDFTVKIACANEKHSDIEHDMHEIPIKELTLRQLQSLKLYSAGLQDIKITDEEPTDPHSIAFPTLAACLQEADERLSFNIEIKYPQLFTTGISESENFFDQNFYMDIILKVVFQYAGDRKIIFSSFDPDMCCLLQLKQNKYPVMFLTQGVTESYPAFKDFRSTTFDSAIQFAVAEQIQGVVLHTEVLLRRMEIIQRVQEKKLTVFLWGADNNNPETIHKLRYHKVDGIIYDRVDCHKPEHQMRFSSSDTNIMDKSSKSDSVKAH